jgi:exodeoxyribonuclease-5
LPFPIKRMPKSTAPLARPLDPPQREMAGNWRVKRPLVETTYGWAITCHQSQGSQQDNAVVWDDGLGRTEAARRCWLYTAITRAEKGLVLLA